MRNFKQRRQQKQKHKRDFEVELVYLEEKLKEFRNDPTKFLKHFNELPLSKATLRGLKEAGYKLMTQVQQLSLPHALLGKDVVVDAKTGSGKTLCFLIPILEILYREKWDPSSGLGAIVIAPTRELAYQIHEILTLVSRYHRFTSTLVTGGKDLVGEINYINAFNILVCTPGRLHQHLSETSLLQVDNLKVLVLDEADMCLSMGFSDQMNDILLDLPADRQTMLFSATQTRDVKNLIRSGCKNPIFCSIHEHSKFTTPASLEQYYIVAEAHEKLNVLYSFLSHFKKKKVLVFVATCKQVKFISDVLKELKFRAKVLAIHGGVKQHKRTEIYNDFLTDTRAVMLATDVAARGLDFPGVDWVVQMDCPEDVDTYIHRVGRTARYNSNGKAVLMLSQHESKSMVSQLNAARIPITDTDANNTMVRNIEKELGDLYNRNGEFMEVAEKAFKAYLKNIVMMKDRKIFDVTTIDQDLLARSYGLVVTPRVRFVERKLNARQGAFKNPTIREENITVESCDTAETEPVSYKVGQEMSLPSLSSSSSKRKVPIKKPAAQNAQWDDDEEPTLDILTKKSEPISTEGKLSHKQKLKQQRREKLLKKEKKKLGKKKKEDEFDDDDEESDFDEQVQNVIDSLPDPDKYKDQDSDDDNDGGTEKTSFDSAPSKKRSRGADHDKIKSKKRKRKESLSDNSSASEGNDDDDEFGNTALQEQERLALQLLSGRR